MKKVYTKGASKSIEVTPGEALELDRLGKLDRAKSSSALASARKDENLAAKYDKDIVEAREKRIDARLKAENKAAGDRELVDVEINGKKMRVQKNEVGMLKRLREQRAGKKEQKKEQETKELKEDQNTKETGTIGKDSSGVLTASGSLKKE